MARGSLREAQVCADCISKEISLKNFKLPMLLAAMLPAVLGWSFAPAVASTQYPLSISSDGRNLLDAHGDPVLFNAATPWHMGARLTREEAALYLDTRADQGINAMLMTLMPNDGYHTGSAENAYGDEPFHAPGDFTQPNDDYFDHVDWVIEAAHARGITMFIAPVYMGWGCGPEGWCVDAKNAGETTMRNFGRWVGNRYKDQPNIVWVHGADMDASLHQAMPIVDAIAEGIKEFDTQHLHTAHCSRNLSGRDCYDRPWLDFDTTYSNCTLTPSQIREDYQRVPWLPTVYIEGIYEFEHNVDGQCLRSQAWWSALGGASGQFYGNGKVWDFPASWDDFIESEGATSMYHFGQLMNARGWGALIPDYDHTALVSGYGNIQDDTYAAAALRSDRNSLIAYLPTSRTVTVAMSRIEGTDADCWWIDPSNGDAQQIGRFPTSGNRQFTPPSSGDWVLIIDNADANLVDIWQTPTAVDNAPGAGRVELLGASPNPFNPRTTISFAGPVDTLLEVAVYDTRGRLVERLFEGEASGRTQSLVWNAEQTASGTYFVRVSGGGESSVRKIALLK